MRRLSVLLACVVMALTLIATAAFAATRTDTERGKYIRETCGTDIIFADGGDNIIDANNCGPDIDQLHGLDGDDALLANDGDTTDLLRGGFGNADLCVVDAAGEVVGGFERVKVLGPVIPVA